MVTMAHPEEPDFIRATLSRIYETSQRIYGGTIMAQTPLEPGHGSMRGTPRWVKLFGIIALVLVLLFVISLLVGVRHGPGLHTPSGDAGGYTRAFGVAGHAEQPSWL
jgi:hypothetical protein